MRWGMVTDKPPEFLGRSLCQTARGYTFGISCDHVTKLCKDFGFGELKGSNTLSFEKPDDKDTKILPLFSSLWLMTALLSVFVTYGPVTGC